MKKLLVLLLVAGVLFSCFANGSKEAVKDNAVKTAVKAAEKMSWDELLQKAKEEIGDNELVIYGTTSRVNEKTFTEATGIKIKAEQPDDTQIYEKMSAEVGNGIYGADVFVTTDSFNLMNLAFANEWVENYVPGEYRDLIADSDENPLVALYYGRLFIYNNGGGALKNAITNIWQVTEPEFKGIEMKSPLLEKCSMNFLITLTSPEWQAKLAEAYRSRYGKEWSNSAYTSISYEWIHKFIQNCTFINKDSTIASDIAKGSKGATGFFVYSKFRSEDYSNMTVAAFDGVEGFAGMLYPIYSVVAANAKYPYAACLYINYLLSNNGFLKVFGKDMGAYSTNTSVAISDGAKAAGDREIGFWLENCVVEDSAYIPTVYAQAFTKIAQWCAGK